ncbi:MAG: DUF2794 domain-containing protein [Proteobacteria bacterium]|nr:DUF2794 domain-containing protein [Pseudomonadota bacterium]
MDLGHAAEPGAADPQHRPVTAPIPLPKPRPRPEFVGFSRSELHGLLELYTRRVVAGQWRDYAIDHGRGMAVFSIYRRSLESPMYSVMKLGSGAGRPGEYVVVRGHRVLKRARTLSEAVEVLDRQPIPVPG